MPGLADPAVLAARPWLRGYDPGVPATLTYPPVPLDALLRRTALRYPDRTALIFFGRRTSYRRLDQAVERMAVSFQRLGLRPGERVALCLPNCPQLVMSFFAVWRAGCIAVPVDPRAAAPELAQRLADAGAAAAVVLDRRRADLDRADLRASVRHLVVAEIGADLPLLPRIGARLARRRPGRQSRPTSEPGVIALGDLVRGNAAGAALPEVDVDAPAVLLYTGGTTGRPKAAVLTHRNLVANACQLGVWSPTLDDGAEVLCSALPLAHGYAMTCCMNLSVLRGWTQVLVPDARDIGRLVAAIERWHVSVLPGVPTLYAAICADPDVRSGRHDLRSIEACISGAAPLPAGIRAEFERLTGGRLVEGYGLSEAGPATHCNPLARGDQPGAIGLPLPDTDCRILDLESESRPVEPGSAGVLCVSGPQVMAGYWQRPADTASALRRDDTGRVWLHTGDVAAMRPDGSFRILDRKKEVIVAAGGLKVYPTEIEDVLSTHPKVRQAAVIGVPVGSADQRAKAFVVLRQGATASPDELLTFLRARLAPYKVPKAVEFRAELPLAFTGKVLRRVLAEQELTGVPIGAGR